MIIFQGCCRLLFQYNFVEINTSFIRENIKRVEELGDGILRR